MFLSRRRHRRRRPSAPWPRRGGRGALQCSVPAYRPPPHGRIRPPRPPRSSTSSPASNPWQTMPPAPDPPWPTQRSPRTSSSCHRCLCRSRPRARTRPSPSPRAPRTTRIPWAVASRIRRRNLRLVWNVGRGGRFPRRACADGTPRGGGRLWRIRPLRRFAVVLWAFVAIMKATRSRFRQRKRRRARRRPPLVEMSTESIARYCQRIEPCPNE
mmetsp:Transcript_3813/g.7219  ORF Transcript_3813/g.7219 Transcript_3813/m.7219 type:complete len:213 (-) Transcript_3813:677-1315(-)